MRRFAFIFLLLFSSSVFGQATVGGLGLPWLVSQGGTGGTTATAYGPVLTGTTSTGAFKLDLGPGTSGYVLTSNGAGAYPTWQAAGGGGLSGLTNKGSVYATGSTSITSTSAMTDGQLLMGSSSGNPALGTITAGSGMSVTNAANSITIASSNIIKYRDTLTNATDNTATDVVKWTVPANTWNEGEIIELVMGCQGLNNTGSSRNNSLNLKINGSTYITGSTSSGSSATIGNNMKVLSMMRVGTDIWATWGYFASGAGVSVPTFNSTSFTGFGSGSAHTDTGMDFTVDMSFRLTCTLAVTDANLYFNVLNAAVVKRVFQAP